MSDDARHARFRELVDPHLGRLLAFARRRVATEADAEDAVQDACVRAWLALDDLRDDASATTWLYQILRGVLGRYHEIDARRNRLAPTSPWNDDICGGIASHAPGALEAIIASAASEAVERALRRLPEQYAAAVELRDLEGLSCRATAEALGVPIGTALSRIHRGRRMLGALIGSGHASVERSARAERASPVRRSDDQQSSPAPRAHGEGHGEARG